jgi:hypothetical protein
MCGVDDDDVRSWRDERNYIDLRSVTQKGVERVHGGAGFFVPEGQER